MVREIEIIFERGGILKAELLDKEAPDTCNAFWNALPVAGEGRHARVSGQEFYFRCDISCNKENNEQAKVGDISFNVNPDWQAVCIYYGEGITKKENPFNKFARITSNMELLAEIGERIWLQGTEEITVRRLTK